ncbi:type II secretion system protein [Sporosarcina sp. FA9]|uniref:type II secretion system protein n=1 Tax=Sporosarcina sp. FA9 TaxID=3413030 RepID=UPI003F655E73
MKNRLQKRLNNEKGLTLVELLAVIVILGIIAAIAVPSIGGLIEKTRVNAAIADAQNALAASNLYFLENPDAASSAAGSTVTPQDLLDAEYLDTLGTLVGIGTDPVTITYVKGSNTISGTVETTGKTKVRFNAATSATLSDKTGYTFPE